MELKTYQGRSMAEALEKVKQDLGNRAVILHTRTVKKGGLMGVGARSVVEITAGHDGGAPAAERPMVPRRTPVPRVQPSEELPAPKAPKLEPTVGTRPAIEALQHISSSTSALRSEMDELRGMVRQLIEHQQQMAPPAAAPVDMGAFPAARQIPDELKDYYTTLIQNAVADELAHEVIARAKERLTEWRARLDAVGPVNAGKLDFQHLIPDALLDVVERMLPPADAVQIAPGRGPKFVALVGPTGVGKTTTIAKLAAQFKLREHRRVALITTDTYRIAAIAQLKAYAEILSLPLEVVYTPEELAGIMGRMGEYDVVLVDTSGRSQNDTEHLGDLQAFLEAARRAAGQTDSAPGGYQPMETHLVLSCTSHPAQLHQVVDRFSQVGIDRVVFTKLDEAVGVGVILNMANRIDVQLSYLTTGQDVPDDIEVGHRRRIAELVLNMGGKAEGEPTRIAESSLINDLA